MSARINNRTMLWFLFITWCVVLTAAVYGRSLTLPFFFDDFVHLPHVDAHSLAELWQTGGTLAYYRPLPFAVWKLMFLLLGRHDPVVQHGFNLMLHFLNGLLVGWLAYRLWSGPARTATMARPFLSATLFLIFPFSYQAVPWVGSLAHLLVTSLILASISAYWLFREKGHWPLAVVSLGLAFLAPFAHENGVLIGPFVAAILVTRPDFRPELRRNLRDIGLWTIPAVVWLPIWWLAPKAIGGSISLKHPEALLQNLAYSVQGAAYPLTWLGGRLRQLANLSDMQAAVGLSMLALGAAAAIQILSRAGRRSLLPWLWLAVALLPMVLFLDFDYVINGPRLLMLASVGLAWLWADVVVQAVRWISSSKAAATWPKRGLIALVAGIAILVLIQNFYFVRQRMTLHAVLGQVYKQAAHLTTGANAAGRPAVLVNLPAWLAPQQATFALGHEGVQFWPHYAPVDTLAAIYNSRPAHLFLLRNEAIRPQMPYLYGLAGPDGNWQRLPAGDHDVFVAAYEPDQVNLLPAGSLGRETGAGRPLAVFAGPDGQPAITLTGARATPEDGGLAVELIWHADQPPADQVTAFVHILDSAGQMVAQLDGDPLAGAYPFYLWPPGSQVRDLRYAPPGQPGLTVLVGLYDRLSGNRLLATGPSGQPLPDNAVVIPVE